jgi:serine/threonine protein kinase
VGKPIDVNSSQAFFNNGVVNTMAENLSSSPLFAGRYEFQTVRSDWDTGRTKFTHLVFDTQEERMGVIKRAEIKSPQAVERLKNEVGALLDLKGFGVPEVYDTGEVEYGSKKYFYIVIEFIEGIRIEKYLDNLSIVERSEIITQLFGLLSKAHQIGIVNGDVDLKHLFWHRDRRQLTVIDWGNAKLHVNPKHKAEFAFDLARSAEIIYSLVVPKGQSSATGSLALPKDSGLWPGLSPVPYEFRELCKWAPRAPSNSIAPYQAQELYTASKAWSKAIANKKPYKASTDSGGRRGFLPWFFGISLLALLAFFVLFNGWGMIQSVIATPTLTQTEAVPSNTPENSTATETLTVTETLSPAETLTETPTTPTQPTPVVTTPSTPVSTPSPATPGAVVQVIDQNNSPTSGCLIQETNSSTPLQPSEGFTRRGDRNWQFGIEGTRTTEEFVEIDFSPCIDTAQVKSMAVNMWVTRLELQRDYPEIKEPGKEIGFFIEDTNGDRREYTIWIDATESMHLKVREGSETTLDEIVSIVNIGSLKIRGQFPRLFSEFPLQIFLDLDNDGVDIIYLKQGSAQAVDAESLDPGQMIRIDNAVRPTINDIQKIGLIGYGGETKTIIWPFVFFGE